MLGWIAMSRGTWKKSIVEGNPCASDRLITNMAYCAVGGCVGTGTRIVQPGLIGVGVIGSATVRIGFRVANEFISSSGTGWVKNSTLPLVAIAATGSRLLFKEIGRA